VRNYLSKFLNDKWMRDNGFFEPPTIPGLVADLVAADVGRPPIVVAEDTQTIAQVIDVMRERGISQMPVVGDGVLSGIVTEADIMEFLGSGDGNPGALVSRCASRQVPTASVHSPISAVQDALRKSNAVVVVDEARRPVSILTRIDLLHYINVQAG